MWLVRCVLLVACLLAAHGQTTDHTDPVTPDTRTILLAVSDLITQMGVLKQDRAKDRSIIASLEQKYDNILEENHRFRERIEILENLHRPDEHQISTRVDQVHKEENYIKKPIIDVIHSSRNMTDDFDPPTDINSKSVHDQNVVESATDDRPILNTPGPTVRTNKAEGMRTKSEHSKPCSSLRVGASTDVVAFSAYLSSNINEPGDGNSIKFDHVVTNVGNGYNPITGAFTCPTAGVYVFTWCTGMGNTGSVYTGLMKNGATAAYSYTADDHYPSTSSQTSVLVLSQGDIVTVMVKTHTASPILWSPYTFFNGFILH